MIAAEARPQAPSPDAGRPRRRSGPAARAGLILILAGAAFAPAPGRALAQPGGVLKDVGFDQNINAQVPLTLPFVDGEGRDVRLADYFGKRPVILVMGYKNCPLLCSQVLGELTRSLRVLDFSVGKEFDIVYVSINPKEPPAQADAQRRIYLKRYNRPGSEVGWHALTGPRASIEQLAKAIGFRYQYSPKLDLYAHAAGFVLLTPSGRIARYFYGIEYPNRELKYALMETSASRIGSPIDKVVLFCYDYDPTTGKYTSKIMNAIRVLGVATALALGTYLFAMLRRDRRMARATGTTTAGLTPGPAIP